MDSFNSRHAGCLPLLAVTTCLLLPAAYCSLSLPTVTVAAYRYYALLPLAVAVTVAVLVAIAVASCCHCHPMRKLIMHIANNPLANDDDQATADLLFEADDIEAWSAWKEKLKEGENWRSSRITALIDVLNACRDADPDCSVLVFDESVYFLDIVQTALLLPLVTACCHRRCLLSLLDVTVVKIAHLHHCTDMVACTHTVVEQGSSSGPGGRFYQTFRTLYGSTPSSTDSRRACRSDPCFPLYPLFWQCCYQRPVRLPIQGDPGSLSLAARLASELCVV